MSGGLPRRAKHLLQSLQLHCVGSEDHQIGTSELREFLKDFGIDGDGFDAQDRRYLSFLQEVGSASLDSLAMHLGVDADFVHGHIEPPMAMAVVVRRVKPRLMRQDAQF